MKLNNKGFAITTILYGTLILFLMLLLSMLGILSTYKGRLEKLIDSNNGARDIINKTFMNDDKLYNKADVGDYIYYGEGIWRVLYKEDGNVYIISISSVVNNVDFYVMERGDFSSILSPYCDLDLVADGICSYGNTMLIFDDNNFKKFTSQYYGVEKSLLDCYLSSENEGCGFHDHMIDVEEDSYWFNNNYNGQMLYYYWDSENRYVNVAGSGKYGIRPVIKLNASVLVRYGEGSNSDPFTIYRY